MSWREYPMTDRYFSRTVMSRQVSLSVSWSLVKTGMLLLLLEEGELQPRRQRFQLKKKMLWVFFFIELEVASRIYFLGEVNGIFIQDRLRKISLVLCSLPPPLGLAPV